MARTTSDYSNAFTRIRDAVAALPVDTTVLDGEAILLRPDNTSDFDGLRSRQGQAEAILVAYDAMERDWRDVSPEPLEKRRKAKQPPIKAETAQRKASRNGFMSGSRPLETRVLRLQPCPRPTAHVARSDALRDDAFEAQPTGVAKDGGPISGNYLTS